MEAKLNDIEDVAPDNDTLVNLLDDVPEDRQKEIAEEIVRHFDIDIKGRTEWEKKRDRWYRLWACIRDDKINPWEGASNVCIPLLSTATNQFHSRSYQAIFAPPGMVKCIPVGEGDYQRSKNAEKFMNWQTMYEMIEYEWVFDRLLQLLPINGIHFKKLHYDKDKERPVTNHIRALDFVLPYNTETLETARRATQRLWLYNEDIEKRIEKGIYKDIGELIKEIPPSTEHEADLDDTRDEVQGEVRHSEDEKPRLILEVHKDYKLDGTYKPYIFTVDYDARSLIRISSRTFEAGAEKKTLNYYIDYHFLPNPEGFYSFGFGHFLEPLNEMANTAFNQIFDSGTLSNMPFGFYGRRASFQKKKIKLRPGEMIPVEDAKQVYFPNVQRVDMVLFQVLGLIQQYIEQFTSTSDYLSGRESRGTKTPTAHGTLAIIEQGLVTFATMTKRIFASLRKELRLLMLLNQIHLPDVKEYRVMEDPDNIAFPDLKREDFESVYDVIPIGDPSYASKLTRRQEAMEFYQIAMTNPLIAGNPELGIPPNMRSLYEVTSDVIDAYDKKNKSKILPPLPPESISPVMENAKFMQGENVDPKPGEDHIAHDRVHMQFEGTSFYSAMPDEYKELHGKHRLATAQMAYEEAMQQAQLGDINAG